jgi:hypothetical protein
MVAFLAHVDARNAGAVVFSTLERGAAVVKQIMLEQLQSAETDAHILKASQVRLMICHYFHCVPHTALYVLCCNMWYAQVIHCCTADTCFCSNVNTLQCR